MKRILSIIILLIFLANNSVALGETDFFAIMDGYVRSAVDCTNIEPVDLNASGTKQKEYSIVIDFREGNNNILLLQENKCRVFYPISDEELLCALFKFISLYDEISSLLPVDGILEIEVFLSDDKERLIISKDTMDTIYSWIE